MIKKIDHLTFAVHDMKKTGKRLMEVYGAEFIMSVKNEKGQYTCDMYGIGDGLIIGLLESTSEEGFVSKHLEKYGESLQHIGIDVEDLETALQTFRDNGIKYSQYEEVDGVRKEVLVSARHGFGAILQVMEWLGEFKNAGSVDRMKFVWDKKIKA